MRKVHAALLLLLPPVLAPSAALCLPLHCRPHSYEGRCSLPSNFDAAYTNALGQAAGALVATCQTGLMATVAGRRLGGQKEGLA